MKLLTYLISFCLIIAIATICEIWQVIQQIM